MSASRLRIVTGAIYHLGTGSLADLDVEVWMQASSSKSFLTRATTDSTGKFVLKIPMGRGEVRRALKQGTLTLRVYRDKLEMPVETGTLSWSTSTQPFTVEAGVNEPSGSPPVDGHHIMGVLYATDRHVLTTGVTVQAMKRVLGSETQLATASPDTDGRFSLSFSSQTGGLDVFVRALDSTPERVATSSVTYDIGLFTRIDLELKDEAFQGDSLWDRLDDALSPVIGATNVSTLDAADAAYLAEKTDQDPRLVQRYLAARRLALRTSLDPEIHFAMMSQGLPKSLPAVSGTAATRITDALSKAVDQGLAPASVNSNPTAVVTALQSARRTKVKSTTRAGAVGTLLGTTDLPPEDWDTFLNLLDGHTGTAASFWTQVGNDNDLSAYKGALQRNLHTARVVLRHAPIIKALQSSSYTFDSARDIARLTETQLRGLLDVSVDGSPVDAPDGIDGTGTTRRDNYAKVLVRRAEAAFPTAAVHRDADGETGYDSVVQFLDDNLNFDFRRTPVSDFWTTATLDNIPGAQQQATKDKLRSMQRMSRVVPGEKQFDTMHALIEAGLDTSATISRQGFRSFAADTSITVPGDTAEERKTKRRKLFAVAQQHSALVMAAFGAHSAGVQGPKVASIPCLSAAIDADSTLVDGIPDYQSMFGSLGQCRVPDEVSVLSPAAYLVDLLQFVKDLEGVSTLSASSLFDSSRRLDLIGVEVTWANTYRAMPHIDLVNEVLEAQVLSTHPGAKQTTRSTKELRASPEHREDDAYDATSGLASKIFPFSLPFALFQREAELFLAHLGVPRDQLLETLPVSGSVASASVQDAALLGMSPNTWKLCAGSYDGGSTNYAHWGYTSAESATWTTLLASVPVFLARAGLEYTDLLDLLHTHFSQANGTITISSGCDVQDLTLTGLTDTNLEQLQRFLRLRLATGWSFLDLDRVLSALGASTVNATVLGQIADLVRMQDLTQVELTEILSWFGDVDTLQGREIDDEAEPSLYDRVFLAPGSGEVAPLALNANRDEIVGTGVGGTYYALRSYDNTTYSDQAVVTTAVLGAMSIDDATLEAILAHDTSLGTSATLTLAHLSRVYAWTVLARGTGLEVEALLDLCTASGDDPLPTTIATQTTLDFLEMASAVKSTWASVDQLRWLAEHEAEATEEAGTSDEEVLAQLSDLQLGLRQLQAEPETTAGYDETQAQDDLQTLRESYVQSAVATAFGLDQESASALLEASGLSAGSASTALAELTDADFASGTWRQSHAGCSADKLASISSGGTISIVSSDAGDTQSVTIYGINDPAEEPVQETLTLNGTTVITGTVTWREVHGVVIDSSAAGTVTVQDGAATALYQISTGSTSSGGVASFGTVSALGSLVEATPDGATSATLLVAGLDSSGSAVMEALSLTGTADESVATSTEFTRIDFVSLSEVAAGVTVDLTWELGDLTARADATAQYDTWVRLDKCAAVAKQLPLSADELAWLLDNQGDWSTLVDLTSLPVSGQSPGTTFDALLATALLFTQRDRMVLGGEDFAGLLAQVATDGDHDDFAEALADAAGWQQADVDHLKGSDGFDWTYPGDWRDPDHWEELVDAMEVGTRLGQAAEQLYQWVEDDDVSADISSAIRAAMRSRYPDDKAWFDVITPIQDELREVQRDALVAHLVHTLANVEDADDLYALLLIDTQITADGLTTRIKSAIGSVQQAIQRAMLHLETALTLDHDELERWKWMKQYRVWEALRKIFLWPENWVAPELRLNKSSLFEELESALRQTELSTEAAEEALLAYIEGLEDIGHLDVVGFYHHKEDDADGTVDVLYVVARGRSLPRRYYLRTWTDHLVWSAWQPIELDIQVDQVLPLHFDGRPMLFWPVFTECSYQQEADDSSETVKYWEIQLAWSEYRRGRWTAQRLSDTVASPQVVQSSDESEEGLAAAIPQDAFVFRTARNAEGALFVSVWIQASYSQEGLGSDPDGDGLVPLCLFKMAHSAAQPEVMAEMPEDLALDGIPSQTGAKSCGFRAAGSVTMGDSRTISRVDGLAVPTTEAENPTEQVLVLSGGNSFWLIPPHDSLSFRADRTLWFYRDDDRAFMVQPIPALAKPHEDEKETDAETFFPKYIYGLTEDALYTPPTKLPEVQEPAEDVAWLVTNHVVGIAARVDVTSTTLRKPVPTTPGSGQHIVASEVTTTAMTMPIVNPGAMNIVATGNVGVVGGGSGYAWSATQTFAYATGDAGDYDADYRGYTHYWFHPLYHPFLSTFSAQLWRFGMDGLLNPDPDGIAGTLYRQQLENEDVFEDNYTPSSLVVMPYPAEDIDFDYGGPYADYNWELFFHAPLLVARWLSRNYQFDEAQRWLHTIYDPTTPSEGGEEEDAQRFWRLKPFYRKAEAPISELLAVMASTEHTDETMALRRRLERQVAAWRNTPFDPHAIASLRTTAYQKAVVMAYLDNLIAWGDHLFRQDTMESVNEATQLYVLANQLLGDKPVFTEPVDDSPAGSSLSTIVDDGVAAAVGSIEEILARVSDDDVAFRSRGEPMDLASLLCFQVPANPWLLEYWDVVEDRLFKIRHGMNIEGVVRQLALYEPPIDPGMLVLAGTQGGSLSAALSSLSQSRPHYRFSVMHQRALALCGTVRALGGALLSALEKKDAEAMAQLRSSHEVAVLDLVRAVKEQSLVDAKASLAALQESEKAAQERESHYAKLLEDGLNEWEQAHHDLSLASSLLTSTVPAVRALSTVFSVIPQFVVGMTGPMPEGKSSWGGENLGKAADIAASLIGDLSVLAAQGASISGMYGSDKRREEGWTFQRDQATQELKGLAKQIEGAEARVEAAERDLVTHDRQVANAQEAADLLTSKYTNDQLYDWMVGQLSSLYSQSYQLAYQVARKAEKAWQVELAASNTWVQYGHWDSLRRGLLAGERLQLDLERMDMAYLDANQRELEITKTISLASVDPEALMDLRESGTCSFSLPEELFDLDHPGHYMRRIKSVSVSMPSVAGAHVPVGARVSLTSSKVRFSSTVKRAWDQDDNFVSPSYGKGSIVTSRGESDSGLFEPNLRDERYLPFEGAGVISDWSITLPSVYEQFDSYEIADVELELRYTARYSSSLVTEATTAAQGYVNPSTGTHLYLFLSARHHLEDAYATFLSTGTLEIELSAEHFPYAYQAKSLSLATVEASVRAATPTDFSSTSLIFKDASDTPTVSIATPSTSTDFAQWSSTGPWTTDKFDKLVLGSTTHLDEVEDLFLVFTYKAS